MAIRHHHYEATLEAYLRDRAVPHVLLDEAKRAILPDPANLSCLMPGPDGKGDERLRLKSFDFVVYGEREHLLVEVKGRKLGTRTGKKPAGAASRAATWSRLESWVTLDDVRSLSTWERLFGAPFSAVLVFLYWCEEAPPGGLFQEMIERRDRWYAVRAVRLEDYRRHMVTRSPKWRTVHLPSDAYERISTPFSALLPETTDAPRSMARATDGC
ncbi:MAG: HYExAFE family protein [Planctomycetota bacterium]